jgi:hypothetical protein
MLMVVGLGSYRYGGNEMPAANALPTLLARTAALYCVLAGLQKQSLAS